ncbi:Nucleoporin [Plasmopara halstedii]|uniref:Nucleoporin n=1 Tax=Plasmopara halstedii TaxID=4781 RepID=A0A0P1AV13_PLAHL|nr:Nucleoporin [Plasmopara halstedii]CEG46207.1 Nucleoporin [Plasmopara halstedii]|eukprot:XP_024582576.1 Nucleoporin [Plasmopara halstedii]
MNATVSKHFVAEKVKALCVLRDASNASETLQENCDVLPLIATGGWDTETNHVSLHLPVRTTRSERELCSEFSRGEVDTRPCELNTLTEVVHVGDVNALQYVATRGENLLISASSAGGIFAYRVSSNAEDYTAMSNGDINKPLAAFVVPQWESVFSGTAATCLDVSEYQTSLVAASANGALAWLKLDDVATVQLFENQGKSKLPINGVKFLGRDSIVASVGSSPGSQLCVYDFSSSNKRPITTCGDYPSKIFTTLETHPTRPEVLITGSDDGSVNFWDRRRTDKPFSSETYHQKAIRALKLHYSSPQYLCTGGDDAVLNRWALNHSYNSREFPDYNGSASTQKSTVSGGYLEERGESQVQRIHIGTQPWNAMAIHPGSDTLFAGSDAQSVVIVQQMSKRIQ